MLNSSTKAQTAKQLTKAKTAKQITITQRPDRSGCVARPSLTALEDRSSIPDAGNNNILVPNWPTKVAQCVRLA